MSGRPDAQEPWDRIDPDDGPVLARTITDLVDWLAENDLYRISDGRVLEDLYGGRWIGADDLAPGVLAFGQMGGDPVRLNFARNAIDLVQTKVCAEIPSVVVSERGGGYAQARRAQRLTEYLDGLMDTAAPEDVLKAAALTALRTGTAFVKTFVYDGRPAMEAVPAEWVFVDPVEGRCGSPRSLYERRPVPRRYLLDRWAQDDVDAEVAIRDASSAIDPLAFGMATDDPRTDLVDVYEAWSLPDPDTGVEGRHVVCVRGQVLLDEPWNVPRFPHAIFRACEPPVGRGFWGQGLLEQLDEAQSEIEFLLAQVSEQIRQAQLKVFVQRDETTALDHIARWGNGNIVEYDLHPPTWATPPAVSNAALQHIDWLVEQLYSAVGTSEGAASSQRPAGVNSGRAILYFHDFQTRRYVDLVSRFGSFCIDVADRLLDRAAECHASIEEDDVGNESTDGSLRWSDVAMDRADFSLALETISAVPQTYAGRMQRIEQLIAQGQVPEGYWAQYLSDPDAYRAEHRAARQAEHIDWLLDRLQDVDADMPPLSDKLDMDLAIEILTGETLDLIRRGADQEVIDRVEDFYDQVVNRRSELRAAAQPPAAPAPAAPAAPAAGPASPLPMGGLAPTQPEGPQ